MSPEEFEHKLIGLKQDIMGLRFVMPQDTPFCCVPAKMQEAAEVLGECLVEFRAAWAKGKTGN